METVRIENRKKWEPWKIRNVRNLGNKTSETWEMWEMRETRNVRNKKREEWEIWEMGNVKCEK